MTLSTPTLVQGERGPERAEVSSMTQQQELSIEYKEKIATLCRTNNGKGLKVVVDGTWYYTSWGQYTRMMKGQAKGCVFQTISKKAATPQGVTA